MLMKTYMNLLILCVVFCQEIIGTLSEEDIGDKSVSLVRQKRVINRMPGEDRKELIRDVPYIVTIKQYRSSNYCAGSILTNRIVITIPKCIPHAIETYRIYAGIARLAISGRYTTRLLIEKREHIGSHPNRIGDGIALVTVDQPFVYSASVRNIELYNGPMYAGTRVTISGWGCTQEVNRGTAHPDYLRSITVSVMDRLSCANSYRNQFVMSESDICTIDPYNTQFCGIEDNGAPVIVKQDSVPHLVGIHLWNKGGSNEHKPDVHANLQFPVYKMWIRQTIAEIERNLHIHQ